MFVVKNYFILTFILTMVHYKIVIDRQMAQDSNGNTLIQRSADADADTDTDVDDFGTRSVDSHLHGFFVFKQRFLAQAICSFLKQVLNRRRLVLV